MRVLLTAFEPFDGRPVNQSQVIAEPLAEIVGAEFLLLPVTFSGCFNPVKAWLDDANTDVPQTLVFSLGEAPVADVQMEQVALNRMHAPGRGDNAGETPLDQVIEPQGPLALESGFSPEKVLRLLQKAGHTFKVSYSAGQYVCNKLYWHLLQHQKELGYRGLFFHVPLEISEDLKKNIVERLSLFIEATKKGDL